MIFVVWQNDALSYMISSITSMLSRPVIQFTMEIQSDNKTSFLNILVNRTGLALTTTVYRNLPILPATLTMNPNKHPVLKEDFSEPFFPFTKLDKTFSKKPITLQAAFKLMGIPNSSLIQFLAKQGKKSYEK
jgi:hypothetical protein